MEKITVTVRTTNPALKVSLRNPVTKCFKHSPRGLIAAVKFAEERVADLTAAQGNLSYPRVTMNFNGADQDFGYLSVDIRDDDGKMTVKAAAQCLRASYVI